MPADYPKNFHHIDHPLLQHKLTHMRKDITKCPSRSFVQLMREAGMILACEVTRDLSFREKEITTERRLLLDTEHKIMSQVYPGKKPVIVPILRSGLILAEGIREIIPTTYSGHIGIYHADTPDDSPLKEYLVAMPDGIGAYVREGEEKRRVFLVDPVIASGKTACAAIDILVNPATFNVDPSEISFLTLIVGVDGMRALRDKHPEVHVYAAVIGEPVVDGNIFPGLGNVSNRLFRTM